MIRKIVVPVLAILSLAVSGCSSVQMHKTQLLEPPTEEEVVVTFIRPAVFFGDGITVEVWDEKTFIGSLKPGTLIQYKTTSGKHVFIGTAENRAYAVGELQSGKQYYLKANIFPGVLTARTALGIVEPGDKRLDTWLKKLQPVIAFEEDRKAVEVKEADSINKAVDEYNAGNVTFSEITPYHAH